MIKFNKPKNLNGKELLNELASVGILLDINTQAPFIDGNGDLWLDIAELDKSAAENIVYSHNGTTVACEPTVEEKLASMGLSLTDLKSALGLA